MLTHGNWIAAMDAERDVLGITDRDATWDIPDGARRDQQGISASGPVQPISSWNGSISTATLN